MRLAQISHLERIATVVLEQQGIRHVRVRITGPPKECRAGLSEMRLLYVHGVAFQCGAG